MITPRAIRRSADVAPHDAPPGSGTRRLVAARPGLRLAGPVLARAALLLAVVVSLRAALAGTHVDLEVYRRAGERWLAGGDPYARRPELPFTYPPTAAVLAGLVAGAPRAALVVLGLATAAAASSGAVAALRAGPSGRRGGALLHVVALAVASEPVLRGLHLGQVNGVVVGLVLLDLLVVPAPHRGWLTGVAAGLKLTPLVFLLLLVVRRERAAAGRLVGAFAGTVALGAVALPSASLRYWVSLAGDADRVGDPGFVDNQSLLGAAARLAPGHAIIVWLVGAAAVLALTLVVLRRTDDPVTGLLACALTGLLVSPISWSHHWLLLPAVGVLLWRHGHRAVAVGVLAVAVGFGWFVDAGLTGPVGALSASSMALAGVVALTALGMPSRRGATGYRAAASARSTTSASSPRVGPGSNGCRHPVA